MTRFRLASSPIGDRDRWSAIHIHFEPLSCSSRHRLRPRDHCRQPRWLFRSGDRRCWVTLSTSRAIRQTARLFPRGFWQSRAFDAHSTGAGTVWFGYQSHHTMDTQDVFHSFVEVVDRTFLMSVRTSHLRTEPWTTRLKKPAGPDTAPDPDVRVTSVSALLGAIRM